MDTDLTPVDERDDEEFEETPLPFQPVSVQDGKPVTIVAQGLSKYFTHKGEIIKAVDGVNFTFTEGQFVTIIGPSGSGKSTLLYVLGGLDQATSGELLVDGVDVRHLSEQQEHQFRRALANDPRVILADEPTGNLDTFNGKRIVELLKKLSEQGKTVIVVTHDRSIAREADVRLEMEDGRIRGMGNYVAPTRPPTLARKKKGKKK
jgi:ABC-type lipoprotein export system ATPase subunit